MEQRQERPVRDRTLWFGVGAGVIVWALHFFAIYVLVDQVCVYRQTKWDIRGLKRRDTLAPVYTKTKRWNGPSGRSLAAAVTSAVSPRAAD